MRTPSLLGIALLCLSAMAAAMDDGSVSVDIQQNHLSNFPKSCHVKHYEDWYEVGPYCVKYFNTACSFADAEFTCRKKLAEGHLVSVHNEQANDDIFNIVMKYNKSSPQIWLGGMQLFKPKQFIWTDGSRWDFDNWNSGQPDYTHNIEYCLEMNWQDNGLWNDDSCDKKKSFICSFQPGDRV